MIIDFNEISDLNRYKLMSDTVVPRPIAWIVTEDEGVINVAPFSYFTPLSSNPALLIVSIGHKEPDVPKDTLFNIRKHKKATICFANINNLEEVSLSSNKLEKEESEVDKYHIETKKIFDDFPSMISSSQSALFCTFYSEIDIPGKTKPIILQIEKQFIEDKRIDERYHVSLENIGRSGAYFKKMVDCN